MKGRFGKNERRGRATAIDSRRREVEEREDETGRWESPSSGWVFRADSPSPCGAIQKRTPLGELILAALALVL